jgi:DNA polymerase II small subunit
MADENSVKELVRILAKSRIVLEGDITPEQLSGIDISLIADKLIESQESNLGIKFVNAGQINEIIESLKAAKTPMPIEISRSPSFNPEAKDIAPSYSIRDKPTERTEGTADDFTSYFNSRVDRMRAILMEHMGIMGSMAENIDAMKKYAEGREVTVLGIVTSRNQTAKGHVSALIEDSTGEIRVLFMNGSSQQSKLLFQKTSSIINDEVIAVKGKLWKGMVIASDLLMPDVPIINKKNISQDIAVAFLSDVHVGSKRFMEKNFLHMIDWLNGNVATRKDLAEKIKYIVIAGDVADGIGIYPGQEDDLAVFDIYAQYRQLFKLLEAIPDYVHVFVMPGNHDAVQRAEPQPPLTAQLLADQKWNNIHIVTNPSYLTLQGMEVLAYHGTSLDDTIASIPGLSYAYPEKAMIELLKRRHLSPVYGGKNVIVPSKNDNLIIDKVPDILHMGHIHKNGISNYHGVEIVNSGTWQARTDFQIRTGHIPTPCILPVYEMKSHHFTEMNFGSE